jgi:hypothetical protein
VERTLIHAQPRRRRATLGVVATAIAAMTVLPGGDIGAQVDTRASPRPRATQRGDRASGNREVTIPFTVGPATCVDPARSYAVTMRIHNVLAQPVGVPVMTSGPGYATVQPALVGRPLDNLRLTCGRYAAQWNGRHVTTGRRLAPGIYLSELVIDGQRVTRKVTLGR